MRDDLNVSEKRLIAALDRLDHFIDRAAGAQDAAPPAAGGVAGVEEQLHAAHSENQRLSAELVLLHERQAALLAHCEAQLAQSHDRLLGAGQEAARLAAANEALAEANRTLIVGAGVTADTACLALEAEIESLRAARAAEIAQMGDLLAELDRMIETPRPDIADAAGAAIPVAVAAPAADAVLEMPMPGQVTGFAEAAHDDGAAEAVLGSNEERG